MRNDYFFDIHTHLAVPSMKSHSVVSIPPEQTRPLGFRFSIGIHPWTIGDVDIANQLRLIEAAVIDPDCVAIGECGLDRSDALRIGEKLTNSIQPDASPSSSLASATKRKIGELGFQTQMELFKRHVEIADLAGKPIIIHCVRAFQELIEVKKKSKSQVPWLVHGFRGYAEIAALLIDHGFHLSFGCALVHRDSPGWEKRANALRAVPLDGLFLETDDTETPPSEIGALYEIAAEIKNISIGNLIEQVTKNAGRVFTHPDFN